MANPQLENGYIRIANEIWQALRAMRIPGEAMQVLMVILEETYGWQKKEAMIQNKTFVEKTGIKKQNINRAISKLTELNLVKVIKKDYDSAPTYCFNKDYETWKKVIKKDYSNQKRLQEVIKRDYTEVSKEITSTPDQPLLDKDSGDPKDSIKDTIKDNTVLMSKNGKLPNASILFEIWNKYAINVPKALKFTDNRRKKALVRLKNGYQDCKREGLPIEDYIEDFRHACIYCNWIPFLRGDNGGWKASFDWLIDKDENMLKIFEGKYGNLSEDFIKRKIEEQGSAQCGAPEDQHGVAQ